MSFRKSGKRGGQLPSGWRGGLLAVLALDHRAHEFRGEPGVVMGKLNADSLAIDDRQLMAKFVANVAFIADPVHGVDEILIVLVRFTGEDAVDTIDSHDAAVRAALEFTAE